MVSLKRFSSGETRSELEWFFFCSSHCTPQFPWKRDIFLHNSTFISWVTVLKPKSKPNGSRQQEPQSIRRNIIETTDKKTGDPQALQQTPPQCRCNYCTSVHTHELYSEVRSPYPHISPCLDCLRNATVSHHMSSVLHRPQ